MEGWKNLEMGFTNLFYVTRKGIFLRLVRASRSYPSISICRFQVDDHYFGFSINLIRCFALDTRAGRSRQRGHFRSANVQKFNRSTKAQFLHFSPAIAKPLLAVCANGFRYSGIFTFAQFSPLFIRQTCISDMLNCLAICL